MRRGEALALRWRNVELDAGTVAALRAHRAARGGLALDLVRDSALVLSNLDGTHRHPERFSRRFAGQVLQARKARSPSTSMSTPAWAARQPTASARCSRADPRHEVSLGDHEGLRDPTEKHPGLLACRNTGVRLCPRGVTWYIAQRIRLRRP
jgi:integrase